MHRLIAYDVNSRAKGETMERTGGDEALEQGTGLARQALGG